MACQSVLRCTSFVLTVWCVCVCVRALVCVRARLCVCVCLSVCLSVCFVYVCVCMCAHVCLCICACVISHPCSVVQILLSVCSGRHRAGPMQFVRSCLAPSTVLVLLVSRVIQPLAAWVRCSLQNIAVCCVCVSVCCVCGGGWLSCNLSVLLYMKFVRSTVVCQGTGGHGIVRCWMNE